MQPTVGRLQYWSPGNGLEFLVRKHLNKNPILAKRLVKEIIMLHLGSSCLFISYDDMYPKGLLTRYSHVEYYIFEQPKLEKYIIYNYIQNTLYTENVECRKIQRYLQRELGRPVTINNKMTYDEMIYFRIENIIEILVRRVLDVAEEKNLTLTWIYKEIVLYWIFLKEMNLVQSIPDIYQSYIGYEESLVMVKITKSPFRGLDQGRNIVTYNNKAQDPSKILCINEAKFLFGSLSKAISKLYLCNHAFFERFRQTSLENNIFRFERL